MTDERTLEQRYFARDEEPDVERQRLRVLESLFDPATTARMELLGVTEGSRCLVIGGGGGSIVRWLADRVGDSGHVTATDLETRYLDEIDAANVQVVRHDIINDDLDLGSFDLVHCRHVLAHLVDREELVLSKMITALKPGGCLFVEEADSTTMRAIDPSHHLSASFDRTVAAFVLAARAESLFDPTMALRLPRLVRRLGLVDVSCEGRTSIESGGDGLVSRFFSLSGEVLRPLLVGKGYVTPADAAARDAAYCDPTFCYRQITTYQLTGRRS